jgi:hypothetical protein
MFDVREGVSKGLKPVLPGPWGPCPRPPSHTSGAQASCLCRTGGTPVVQVQKERPGEGGGAASPDPRQGEFFPIPGHLRLRSPARLTAVSIFASRRHPHLPLPL